MAEKSRRFQIGSTWFLVIGLLILTAAIRWSMLGYFEGRAVTLVGFFADVLLVLSYGLWLQHLGRRSLAIVRIHEGRVVTKTRVVRTERTFGRDATFWFGRLFPRFVLVVRPGALPFLIGIADREIVRERLREAGYACRDSKLGFEVLLLLAVAIPFVALFSGRAGGEWVFLGIFTGILGFFLLAERRSVRGGNAVVKRSLRRIFGLPRTRGGRRVAAVFGAAVAIYVGLVFSGYEDPRDRRVSEIRKRIEDGKFAEARRALDSAAPEMHGARFKNLRAWFLTTSPERSLRDYGEAVREAKIAVRLSRETNALDTYACAKMGAGERAEALRIAERAKLKNRVAEFAAGKLCRDEAMEKTFAARSLASEGTSEKKD